jgi:photosystem II stability/assembly factor-like uncharacterized protein
MTRKKLLSSIFVLFFIFNLCNLKAQPWMKASYFPDNKITYNFYDIQHAFANYLVYLEESDVEGVGIDKLRGTGIKQFKRWEYTWQDHVYPSGEFRAPDYYYNEKQRFIKENPQTHAKSIYDWIPLGIKSWTNGLSGYNPGNGRINVVEVDPNNANIIYIGSPSGGIWKSVDGGLHWNTTTDDFPVLGVSAIAVNPSNSNDILIGTGDRDAWDSQSIGIYRSIDGGATWNPSGMNFGQNYYNINKILYNPQNLNTVFAASTYGIHRSTDGGNTWNQVYSDTEVKDLEFKPNDTTHIYGSGKRFVKSANGGLSFTANTTSLPVDTVRMEISVSAADPSYVYLVVSNASSRFGGLYRSTDAGTSFTQMSSTPNILGYAFDGLDDKGQGWYDLAIAASPTNKNEIYVGGINIWKSTDGGISWNIATHWVYEELTPEYYSHADIHFLQFFGNTLYCGSDGGIFKSTDGTNFSDLSAGLEITQFYALGGSEIQSDMIVAGAQDNGSNLLKNGSWTHLFGADGMEALISHTNTNTLYVTYQYGGILRSDDGGDNFYGVQADTVGGGWLTPYLMHPSSANTLYAAYRKVYKTMDGGLNWRAVSHNLASSYSLRCLAVAPSDTNYIYASYSHNLFYSTDGGQNWTFSIPQMNTTITDIEVHPTNPQRLWISLSGTPGDFVMESTDNGQNFSDISGNLTNTAFKAIVFDKNYLDALYLGTKSGVYYTDTTMSGTWILHGQSLPNCEVRELEINYAAKKIRAATYGRGIWEYPLYPFVAIEEANALHFNLYPNPASDYCIIELKEKKDVVNISLFNVGGKLVKNENFHAVNSVTIDLQGLAVGQYFIRIEADGITAVKALLLRP